MRVQSRRGELLPPQQSEPHDFHCKLLNGKNKKRRIEFKESEKEGRAHAGERESGGGLAWCFHLLRCRSFSWIQIRPGRLRG